ncbi:MULTISPECIES: hypothetical protein [unclassified Anabaena]|uniref:hypothetical protein n=1 Tax=unclassified Anabaena TaxID=2619674 RepID=UPI000A6AF05B|nr:MULTISPECIES: hypothetical protein [unclassified Anabaena]
MTPGGAECGFDKKRAIPTERFAIASLDEGKSVIPVWLDVIYQELQEKLKAQIN